MKNVETKQVQIILFAVIVMRMEILVKQQSNQNDICKKCGSGLINTKTHRFCGNCDEITGIIKYGDYEEW